MTDIIFLKETHNEASLKAMEIDDLLTLRNLVASNLGVASVRNFKSHEVAVTQTWKALVRYESAQSTPDPAEDTKPAKGGKPKKDKPAPKPRGLAKSAEAKTVKRPTAKMFSTIKKTGEHDGSQGRAHRWTNYKDGMTLVDIIEGEGTEPWDVYNWQGKGIMSLTEPTEAEHAERRAAWYAKHDREDPELAKVRKASERETAKATREAEQATKKTELEAAKKVKAEEREAAKKVKADEAAAKAKAG